MDRSDSLKGAELAFLNAPFQADGWGTAMRHLAGVTGSRYAQLLGIGGPALIPLNVLSDEPHDPHGHLANPALHGPGNWRVAVSSGPMIINHEAHYALHRQRPATADYDDAVSDLGIPFGCQSALLFDRNGLLGLALLRSDREGPCSAETLQQFEWLARQAQRAVRVQLALGQDAAEMMLSGLAGRDEATMLLDRYGNLCAMTEAAETLFEQAGGLRLVGLSLHLADHREDRAFRAALRRLIASDGLSGPVLHEASLGRCKEQPNGRWRLVAARLPAVRHGFGFEPAIALTVTPRGSAGHFAR